MAERLSRRRQPLQARPCMQSLSADSAALETAVEALLDADVSFSAFSESSDVGFEL